MPARRGDAGRGAGAARAAALRRVRARGALRRERGSATCRRPGARCPGELSDTVADLLERGMLAGHVTRGPCFGAPGGGDHGRGSARRGRGAWAGTARSWAPGPGILGSASALGHGGLAALTNAHAALSLGCRGGAGAAAVERRPARAPPRPEPSHRRRCCACCCAPVRVPVPSGLSLPSGAALERRRARGGHEACRRGRVRPRATAYLASGLPARHDGALVRRGPRLLPRRRWRAERCWPN